MFWGIIHRKILVELIKIFVIALVALTGLILMAGVISEAMKNGLGPAQIMGIIPLLLPSLLPYTVPTTTLFTTCIVYGRLSSDNEILAMKSAGIHIIHVIWPAVFLGAATGGVTMYCYFDVIPMTGSLLRNQPVGDMEEMLYTMLRKDGCIKHSRINYEIYVKTMQGRKLYDVQFMRRAVDNNGFDVIARAKEAELRVDQAHKKIIVDMRQCHITNRDGTVGWMESRIWDVEFPEGFEGAKTKFRAMDMTWRELAEYEQKNQEEKTKLSMSIVQRQAEYLQNPRPEDKEAIHRMEEERKVRDYFIFSIQSERQMRPALALGCLCFALVGCPVGIWFSKSDYLSAFITCFLPIVIIYYPLMFCMLNMASSGKLPPWLAVYDADTIMIGTGFYLFRRLTHN